MVLVATNQPSEVDEIEDAVDRAFDHAIVDSDVPGPADAAMMTDPAGPPAGCVARPSIPLLIQGEPTSQPPRPISRADAQAALSAQLPTAANDATPPPAMNQLELVESPPMDGRLSSLPPPEVLDTPILGEYRVEGLVGHAPDTELLRAVQVRAGQDDLDCVLKKVVLQDAVETELRGLQLYSEGQLNMALSHPNLVRVFDYGAHEGRVCLAREFVTGRSLHAIRTKGDPMSIPVDAIVYIAQRIADVLAYVHEQKDEDGNPMGLVHGRICPSDILIAEDGTVKLTEMTLGPSDRRFMRLPQDNQAWRRAYMAPEQLRKRSIDGRSDLFSLGLVIAELIGGEPIAASGAVKLNELSSVIKERCLTRRDTPLALRTLLTRMTAVDARERPGSAREVADYLAGMASEFGHKDQLDARIKALLTRSLRTTESPPSQAALGDDLFGDLPSRESLAAPIPKRTIDTIGADFSIAPPGSTVSRRIPLSVPVASPSMTLRPLVEDLQGDLTQSRAPMHSMAPRHSLAAASAHSLAAAPCHSLAPRRLALSHAPSIPAAIPTGTGANFKAMSAAGSSARIKAPDFGHAELSSSGFSPSQKLMILGDDEVEDINRVGENMKAAERKRRFRNLVGAFVLTAAGYVVWYLHATGKL